MFAQMITLKKIPDNSELSTKLYGWHRGFAASNNFLFPRQVESYSQLVEDGFVWCALDEFEECCAMAYCAEDGEDWEIGGVMVSSSHQGKALGSTIMKLALCTNLVELDPLSREQRIITHVHAENNAPRNLIEQSLAFKHVKSLKMPASYLPGLKADDSGFIHGDEYEISTPETLDKMATWCVNWNNQLADGTPATIELPLGLSLQEWGKEIEEMANLYRHEQTST
jgi:hypothetical protein